jgi:hypothetical protein
MAEIRLEEAEAWLRQPTIVLVPSGNAYGARFVLDALTQEEILASSGPRLEIRGPLGRPDNSHLWMTSINDGRLLEDPDPAIASDLSQEAQSAADSWYAWEQDRA